MNTEEKRNYLMKNVETFNKIIKRKLVFYLPRKSKEEAIFKKFTIEILSEGQKFKDSNDPKKYELNDSPCFAYMDFEDTSCLTTLTLRIKLDDHVLTCTCGDVDYDKNTIEGN